LPPLHQDRRRACSFGSDAELYDRARPDYPDALIDDLMAEEPRRVLDVGCGTGKAARLFLARGCDVIGVEPDASMASVARRHGVVVEVASFEEWAPGGRSFELVASGQAWHWIDPDLGLAKAAAVLEPGRRFAAFGNIGTYDLETRPVLRAVYERLAPDFLTQGGTAAALGAVSLGGADPGLAALRASGVFERAEVREYRWSRVYSAAEWLAQVSTHSNHRVLPADHRARLLDELRRAIDELGGTVTIHYETDLMTGLRRAGGRARSSSPRR